jgi:hypothetical protein
MVWGQTLGAGGDAQADYDTGNEKSKAAHGTLHYLEFAIKTTRLSPQPTANWTFAEVVFGPMLSKKAGSLLQEREFSRARANASACSLPRQPLARFRLVAGQ